MKKQISVIMAAIMIASAASGCQSPGNQATGATSGGEQKEIKTFSLYTMGQTTPLDLSNTPVGKKVTEITGVKLKCDYQVGSDEATIATTQTASGQYDDLLNPHNELNVYRDAGALVPLDDYIEKYGTNIKKWYGDDLKKLKDPETGHIYSLSPARKTVTPIYPLYGFYVQKQVLKANNWPNKMTLDDFFAMLEKFAKEHPTINGQKVIPFASRGDRDGSYLISGVPALLAGYPNTGGNYYDADGTAHNFSLSKWSHDYYKKLNEAQQKGMIDPNMFSQTADQFYQNIASGKVLAFYGGRWEITNQIASLENQKMYDQVPFAISVVFPGVEAESYNGIESISAGQGICITTSCKDPLGAFKFLDAMCSEEVQKLVQWGIEGEDYTVVDGKMTLTEEQLKKADDADYAKKQGVGQWWNFPHPNLDANTKFSDGNYVHPQNLPLYISSHYKDYEKEVLQGYKVSNLYDMLAPMKSSKFGYGWDISIPDSQPELQDAQKKSGDITNKYLAKLINAKAGTFEDVWNEYCNEMKAAKYNSTESYFTQQVQKRIKEWN